ncbi:tripartite-type tricarboxylate transporter receptor subunit TctC [Bradyrhizobium sp. LM2.7]
MSAALPMLPACTHRHEDVQILQLHAASDAIAHLHEATHFRFEMAAALPTLSSVAWAYSYPSRPVHIIVGFAAGGPNDILARLIGQWLSERLGRPFVIENRPGAGSNIATEAVVRAAPDGLTLLLVGTPNAINTTLYEKLEFDFIRDIAPVAGLIRGALVMVVHPSVPAKTLPEFIDHAKAHPGKLFYGSGGVGGITHITAELFKQEAGGLDIQHVPIAAWRPRSPIYSVVRCRSSSRDLPYWLGISGLASCARSG